MFCFTINSTEFLLSYNAISQNDVKSLSAYGTTQKTDNIDKNFCPYLYMLQSKYTTCRFEIF